MSNFITWAAKSYGGAIYASGFESLNISNWKFTSNIGSLAGCDLYLNSGTSIINNSEFLLDSSQTSIYIIGGDFTGQSINMTNTLSTNSKISNLLGGGIYGSNINTFSVLNSNFNKINYAENGGAIYLLGASLSSQTIPTSPSWIIRTWVFNGNSAINGGVIYILSNTNRK